MQHTQRLDQRLRVLRDEVRTMTQEEQQGERVWREKLQRCQRQLKAKEEEMSRQSQYFENFKVQLQHKLSVARDREQTLQNRIYTLEKQLLEMTVNAVTGMATMRAVRITAGTVTHLEEQHRLSSMRGEGEGEEEKKEERRLQWQSNVATEREERKEDDEGKMENDVGGQNNDAKLPSNEARLQSFIISLQEDLKVLLEREEDRVTEQRGLMEQLQEAQENSHFLGCRVEDMKAEVQQLKLSESSLMEEVDELKEENHRLQQTLREAANQTPNQSFSIPESSCPGSGTSSAGIKPKLPLTLATGMGPSLTGSSGEPSSEEGTVPAVHHQAAAESTHRPADSLSPSPKSKTPSENEPLKHFLCFGSDSNPNFKPPAFTTESLDELKLGDWCSKGIFNVEECPSEESDALRAAYRSLGFGEDLQKLQQQRDHLQAALQHMQEQLQRMSEENTQLKLQLRKLVEEQRSMSEEGSSGGKICRSSPDHGDLPSSSTEDEVTHALPQEDLIQALNRENRALADRIQELFVHIKLREEETVTEQAQLKESISRREDDVVRLEKENQEQACLISELTKKTEDDLNTIMELQQKLLESEEQRQELNDNHPECSNALWLSDHNSVISGSFPLNNKDECADVLKGEEAQLIVNQEIDLLTADSASDCLKSSHSDSLWSNSQKTLHVSVLTDEMVQLTTSIQSLKTEQKVLTDNINALKEQQQDVSLSVHQQTEEKKQLTRAVWGLKEEKDCVSQSLACLKQEKEQLNRTVCGLKDKKDQFDRSMSGVKQEKECLTQSILVIEKDKEAITESLSRVKAERDQIMQSLQSLQAESDELCQAVINLKEERDKLTNSLLCLKEQRDQEQLSDTLKENPAELIKSVKPLKEEKESTVCLKQNRKQIMLVIQGPKEEGSSLQAEDIQTPTEASTERQNLLNADSANVTKKIQSHAGNDAAQRCQTNHTGSLTEEERDLMEEIEALGAKLKRSQEELDKSRVETERLCSELCHSDIRREEAERKAGQAAEKLTRLSDVTSQLEEINKENDNLTTQVRQLQIKVTNLLREKSDILSLKSQTEEQYSILTAQLKAKTVALEELNSEYIVLKRGQGNRDELSAALVSLRTRYNDIRAKYDVLLKRKSQTDLDIAPLKAKLSCLVMKCQERNSLLAQVMKIMHRRGFVDSSLTQQVEMLLKDAALQDYTSAFTPVDVIKKQDHWTGLKPEFISMIQDYSRGFTPDPAPRIVLSKQQQNWVAPEAGTQCCGGETHTSAGVTSNPPTNLQVCIHEVAAAGKKITNSPVKEPASVPESSPAVPLKQSLVTVQQSSHFVSGPEEAGLHHMDGTEKPSSDRSTLIGSSLSRASPSSSAHLSPSRRLSSPEKILHLHEQLQKTLMSSYQDQETRGRQQQSKRGLPRSASENLNASSHTKKQNLSFDVKQTASLPATAASTQAKPPPAETAQPAATNKSATLFNAVISRSAGATFRPGMFTNLPCKGQTSKTTSTPSSSSPVTAAPREDKPISRNGVVTASPETPDALRPASADQNQRTTASDGKSGKPEITASNSTAPEITVSDTASGISGTALGFDFHELAAFCTRSASSSPEKTKKSARERIKADKPKPEAPAAVGFVEVIKTVGQSSLLIGWERPPLDELFCSNGTFVYGYRVFVDGDFHKSVMSSACTKCVLENVDLSVPHHISVQTLGSNGLASDSVHTAYRTSARSAQL
ncbi:golgin subfamily B member 1-like [Salarias fasciatus]|uniref:golgin subfamily B member 1-like n=1 Tax=Salarias fasciatus TaxID=181472 RepID=UPI001176E8EA|nr:golgin subfamily B member 1-like [Salarias fasciatus]